MSYVPQATFATYNARRLSQKHLAAWSATGEAQQRELKQILHAVMHTVQTGRSPSKAIKATLKRLEGFFGRNEVRGDVQLINQRHIHFRLAFPVNTEDKLTFRLLDGNINARSGATKLELQNPIQLSLHALQRLFERLDQSEETAVLDEIYSCLEYAGHWHAGGTEAKAKCWPLISRNGFFVATTEPESKTTTIITWIRQTGSGRKWGLPLQTLASLVAQSPSKLKSREFAREFIRSFPWMRYEHAPADDYFTRAEAQRDLQLSISEEEAKDIDEAHYDDIDWSAKSSTKLSASYIPGFNYEKKAPPFSSRSVHRAIVVQQNLDGTLTLGLNNGWVGKIPKRSVLRGIELIPGYRPPRLGDEVSVVVHKIQYYATEGAYSVSLDTLDVSEANWIEIEKSHPVGFITNAKIIEKFKDEFVLSTGGGLRGSILASDVQHYLQKNGYLGSVFGLDMDVQVTGFKAEKKCLVFSLVDALLCPDEQLSAGPVVGDRVLGTCVFRKHHFARIELPFGHIGVLLLLNHWGRELPNVGEAVESTIIFSDQQHHNFLLATDPPISLDRMFPPALGTPEIWDEFMDRHRVGDVLEVQVLFWAEDWQSFVANTGLGVCGMLSPNELDWGIDDRDLQKKLVQPGDIFKVLIKKIDSSKRRLSFSKKRFESRICREKLSLLKEGDAHRGLVVTVQDYGYFIWLPDIKLQGLLHKSKISADESFDVGDSVRVIIENIDTEAQRISLASETFQATES
jgi:ribosomal protein S1